MVGAAVLYFLIAGGFLQGSLFPDLSKTGFSGHPVTVWGLTLDAVVPNADFAKLVVWSFIGGFSERFVSSALEKSETSATVAENKQDDGIMQEVDAQEKVENSAFRYADDSFFAHVFGKQAQHAQDKSCLITVHLHLTGERT